MCRGWGLAPSSSREQRSFGRVCWLASLPLPTTLSLSLFLSLFLSLSLSLTLSLTLSHSLSISRSLLLSPSFDSLSLSSFPIFTHSLYLLPISYYLFPDLLRQLALLDGSASSGQHRSRLSEVQLSGKESQRPTFGMKRDLVQLIGNLSYRCPSIQGRVREIGAVHLLLNQCSIDHCNPCILNCAVKYGGMLYTCTVAATWMCCDYIILCSNSIHLVGNGRQQCM